MARLLPLLLTAALLLPVSTQAAPGVPEEGAAEAAPVARDPFPCVPGHAPCVRPYKARLLALPPAAAGVIAGGVLFLVVGDRLEIGDPAMLLAVGGTITAGGALLGMLAGIGVAETPVLDRPGRPVLAWSLQPGGDPNDEDSDPPSMQVDFAPTLGFPGSRGRVRPFGRVGWQLGPTFRQDPRPQLEGGEPTGLSSDWLAVQAGVELSFALPYPAPSPAPQTGPVELGWQPQVEVRRRTYARGTAEEETLERVILTPLSLRVRWHLSPRQRLTLVFGPRLDVVGLTGPAGDRLAPAGLHDGPFYGEVRYTIDVPLSPADSPLSVNAAASIGYIQGKVDGRSVNVGAIIGYVGPFEARWDMRFRKRGADSALHLGVGAWLGTRGGLFVELGLVTPEMPGREAGS